MIKEPTQRKCVCCREMKDKKNLYRIVSFDGRVYFDRTGKAQGRGAYVCRECIDGLKLKKPLLSRSLKKDITDSDFLEITEGIKACH